MSIGVIISLISLGITSIGLICGFAFGYGSLNQRVTDLEKKTSKLDEIETIKISIAEIKVMLEVIQRDLEELKKEK
jgi:hypothetical protein